MKEGKMLQWFNKCIVYFIKNSLSIKIVTITVLMILNIFLTYNICFTPWFRIVEKYENIFYYTYVDQKLIQIVIKYDRKIDLILKM